MQNRSAFPTGLKPDAPALIRSATVMWWIPAGHVSTVEEAKIKLELLRKNGPTPQAFTFKQQFSVEEMLKTS